MVLLTDNYAGKPEGIRLMIGRRPLAAVRQLARRPTDAGIHEGRRRPTTGDAGAARQRRGGWPTARQLPDAKIGTSRSRSTTGPEGWLDRHQHEERLEENLWVREIACRMERLTPVLCLSWPDGLTRISSRSRANRV